MPERVRDETLDQVVARRFGRLVDAVGMRSPCRRLAGQGRDEWDPSGPDPGQLDLREIFVRADPEQRSNLDLLCVVLIEREGDAGRPDSHELVVFGPEAIRGQMTLRATGITVADLRVGPAAGDLRSVSVLLFRVQRHLRVGEIVASIEDLGRVLDYRRDAAGSNAVARAVVRRLEVLMAAQGVAVSIAGTAGLSGDLGNTELHYALVETGAMSSTEEQLEVRQDQVTALRSDGRADGWRDSDFVHLRVGKAPARRSGNRSLGQLRREYQLAEAGLGPAGELNETEQNWGVRAARIKQAGNAERVVRLARQGDAAAALQAYRAALAQPEADPALGESLARRVTSLRDYWSVDDVLQADLVEATVDPTARAVRQQVALRLDQLLSVPSAGGDVASEFFIPIVTPIVFEVGDALVPSVDSSQDGGHFLQELIPAMRDRILKGMGVRVPGVRVRGNAGLPPAGFTVQLDEVPVLTGEAFLGVPVAVLPPDQEPVSPAAEWVDRHPLTGRPGLWLLEEDPQDQHTEADRLTLPQYLVNRIELVLRANLTRFLGPQEVEAQLDQWLAEHGSDSELAQSTLPDRSAQLRLTWIAQALLDDGVPATEWRAILEAVRAAGRITASLTDLRRAVRARLRDQLPVLQAAERVAVPTELEAAVVGDRGPHGTVLAGEPRRAFLHWLRTTARWSGPAISLVVGGQDARELIAPLARSENHLISTFTADELPAP